MALDAPLAKIDDDVSFSDGFCPLVAAPNTLPGEKPGLFTKLRRPPQTHTNLYFSHKSRPLPSNWSERIFKFEGLDIPYYVARATQTNAVEGAVSGLKPDHAVSRKEIKANKKHGISTVWLNLPNPSRSLGYMDFYKRLEHYFFTSPDSPLYTEFPLEIPRMAKGHSTGGGTLFGLATHPETREQYAHFKLITGEAIFMDNANAARHNNWFLQNLFTAYATINKHYLPHETLFGLAYLNTGKVLKKAWSFRPDSSSQVARLSFDACIALYVAGQTVKEKLGSYIHSPRKSFLSPLSIAFAQAAYKGIENLAVRLDVPSPKELMDKSFMSERGSPTYGQILETRRPHRQVRDQIVNDPSIRPVTHMLLIAGENDPYSSLKPQQDIANALGIPIFLSPTQHNPLTEDKHARKFKMAVIKRLIPEVQKLPKTIRQAEPEESKKHWPSFDRLFVQPASHIGRRFYAAASGAYNAIPSMPRPSLDRLALHMPSLFSRKLP